MRAGRSDPGLGVSCRLHIFNPACELELTAMSRRARRASAAIRVCLETLTFHLADAGDTIALERTPSRWFLDHLKAAGWPHPRVARIVWRAGGPTLSDSVSANVSALAPWGWSPMVARLATDLGLSAPTPLGPTTAATSLHSKSFSTRLANEFISSRRDPLSCTLEDLATVCHDFDAVEMRIAALRDAGREHLVIKGVYGVSGREAIRSLGADLNEAQKTWIRHLLERDGEVCVEPWHERFTDLSVRAEILEDGSTSRVQFGRSLTDGRGQFRGAVLAPLAKALTEGRLPTISVTTTTAVHKGLELATAFVGERLSAAGHRGPWGMDAMLIRRFGDARTALQPLVEINPRTTMGHVAAALQTRLRPESVGLWVFVRDEPLGLQGPRERLEWLARLDESLPMQMDEARRVIRGVVATTDPHAPGPAFTAMLVGESLAEVGDLARAHGIELDTTPVGYAPRDAGPITT